LHKILSKISIKSPLSGDFLIYKQRINTMKISMMKTEKIKTRTIEEVNGVVAAGFGIDPGAMYDDTKEHLAAADVLQLTRLEDGSAGAIAMYRRCLWRQGDRACRQGSAA
jgi:hypothetical protein